MGARLEVVEKEMAKERQREGQRKGGGDRKSAAAKEKSTSRNLREVDSEPANPHANKTSARVGAAVGMSESTYQKAKTVIAMAEEDPETFGAIDKQRLLISARRGRLSRGSGGRGFRPRPLSRIALELPNTIEVDRR